MSKLEIKRVKGFPGYLVRNDGVVINEKRGSNLRPSPSKLGYMYVTLYKDGKPVKKGLQVLVAEAFVPGKTKKRNRVRFQDHNKANCNASNLIWATHQEACKIGFTGRYDNQFGETNPNNKLSEIQVKEIREKYEKGDTNQRQLADDYGVSYGAVQKILSNRSWKKEKEEEKA